MSQFLQFVIASFLVLPAAAFAWTQFHRMRAAKAVVPIQMWVLQRSAALMANYENPRSDRIKADKIWRIAMNSDALVLFCKRAHREPIRGDGTLNAHSAEVRELIVATAIASLAFDPIIGPTIVRKIKTGEISPGKPIAPPRNDTAPGNVVAKKVEEEAKVVSTVLREDLLCIAA
jgi:hypothetical protein